MADDFDVEALLEAPYKVKHESNGSVDDSGNISKSDPKDDESRSRKSKRDRSRSREKRKSSRDSRSPRRRSKSPRKRSKSPHRSSRKSSRHRSRSRSKHERSPKRSRSSKHESRSRHHSSRNRRRSESKGRRKRSLTPITLPGRNHHYPNYSRFRRHLHSPGGLDDLSPEERDARTIFCMQLSQRIRSKDLEEFFSSVGKVRDVRLITCNKTRRFKGIAYVEFKEPESVALALGLNGQKLLGIPIVVQPTQAEKNRVGNSMPNMMPRAHPGPVRLYVGSLHYNITEGMLRGIFEPFGKIDSITLMLDPDTGRSKGYGFVTYHNAEDAKKALEQMNGFELAGRPIKVNNVTDRSAEFTSSTSQLDVDDLDRAGIDLGATGRLQLMYKLAEGTGMQLPPAATNALNLASAAQTPALIPQTAPPITTQCFLLANMFDPTVESNAEWESDIKDDVIEECNKHGGVVHIFVDKASPQGNVYVKCPSMATAIAAVNSLHGRWFGGRMITAAYVPVANYHNLFPETVTATTLLELSRKDN